MKIFIELWKAKNTWLQLSRKDRESFVSRIGPEIAGLISKGIIVDSWGMNDDSSLYKADYDFFAITKLPSAELLEEFQQVIEKSGWYNYFDQVNVTGQDISAETVIRRMVDLKRPQIVIEKNI